MACDHGAFDVNDDEHGEPDHHRNRGRRPRTPRRQWATERDEAATNLARARNIMELDLSVAVAPEGGADVDSHAASVATRIGAGKRRAMAYCDVGLLLARMPRMHEFARSGALPHEYLAKMANAVVAVSAENIEAVESRFLDYLRPRRDFQALPGHRVWARELRRMVELVEPISVPADEDAAGDPASSESYSADNEYPGDHGELHAILRKDRLAEFDATVRAIRDCKIKAGEECTLGDALMHMSRGEFAGAKVTLNVYADGNADEGDLRLWLDGAGWLPKHLTRRWLERADDARLSADSSTGGYTPTEAQKARVRGRDGGCRFPGCNVPAHKCQIDHVINFDPEAAANPLITATSHGDGSTQIPLAAYLGWLAGDAPKGAPGMGSRAGFLAGTGVDELGVTATWNLQCLCQHHHNLKTSRHWHARMHDDGAVTWVDHTGDCSATTVPHGPIAHIRRQTFDQRATRLTATIRADNARRIRAEAEAAAAMDQAAGNDDVTWDFPWPDEPCRDASADAAGCGSTIDDGPDWENAPARSSLDDYDDEWSHWSRACRSSEGKVPRAAHPHEH